MVVEGLGGVKNWIKKKNLNDVLFHFYAEQKQRFCRQVRFRIICRNGCNDII